MNGFSPRKAAISSYVFTSSDELIHLLKNLGKFKIEKTCIYIKKLSDINIETLKKLCQSSIDFLSSIYEFK